jgi:hypothetical protein
VNVVSTVFQVSSLAGVFVKHEGLLGGEVIYA